MKASFVCALLLLGCAAGGEAPVAPTGAPSHQRLQQVRSEHTDVVKRLSEAPAEHVESCRATQGDCLFQVSDKRARLVGSLRLNPCDQTDDFQTKSSCITSQLEGTGRSRELTEYLSVENWCFKQLHACTLAKVEEARQGSLEARYASRKRELEARPEAQAARSSVELTHARIEYLRATLPPAVEACTPTQAVDDCEARVETNRQKLDQRLREEGYDVTTGVRDYASVEQAEDACIRPELECMTVAVRSHGVFPEARKWVDRNLELLSRRQQLLDRTSASDGQRCVAGSQQQHQAGIVSAYVAYAKQPVVFFRTQLDKAFLELHQAQVTCLSAKPQRSPAPVTAKR
jgi:hypothetical protein